MTDAWKEARDGKLPKRLKGKKKQEIVTPKSSGVYSEDPWGLLVDVDDVQLQMAFVRRRIDQMNDWELFTLIQRIERFAKELPNTPMTVDQYVNANKMVCGFKSIFVVERMPALTVG